MPIQKGSASDVTRHIRVNASTVIGKSNASATPASVPAAKGAIVTASAVAAKIAPTTSTLTTKATIGKSRK